MTVWILWFTLSIGTNLTFHVPVDEEFSTLDACITAAVTHWAPLLKQQFPDDPHLVIQCLPSPAEKVTV